MNAAQSNTSSSTATAGMLYLRSPLVAGDIIVTGTPGGVGDRRDPPLYMKTGDIVEVEISEVGKLVNPVLDENIIL